MSKKKKFYFHPGYCEYLTQLESFAKAAGGRSRENAIMIEYGSTRDSRGVAHPELLSPGQAQALRDYYNNDIKKVEESYNSKKGDMKDAWYRMTRAAKTIGIEIQRKGEPEWPLYEEFCRDLMALEAVCDLRAILYRWIKSDRERIARGIATVTPSPELVADPDWQAIDVLTIPRILQKYDDLLKSRAKKGAK